jgi:hypothetical protein
MSRKTLNSLIMILVLAAIPLMVGSQCAFFFSTGGSSDDDDEDKEEQVAVVATGSFGAMPVAGANYVSGSVSGVTDSNGEFQYEIEKSVQFSIGDIKLGQAVNGKSLITVADLVAKDADDTASATNIERLLLSLDAEPGDEGITIPADVRASARLSNEPVSSAIQFLDFADDDAFANAASQLVSVLTGNYPFTAVLVDAETVHALHR